ncbi:MAG: flagellar biosynthetic protein FliO [Pseudomonadota bacterium]|nr:flagellar biosynthetic protein FliO [Pseudomonadota bacterium]
MNTVPVSAAPSIAGGALEMVLSLLIVLAVMFALAWLLKRVQGARGSNAGALQVHAGVALGAKERVVWLEAGGKHFLLGVSANGVNLIHRYDEAPPLPERPTMTMPPLARAFSSWLDEAMKKKPQ